MMGDGSVFFFVDRLLFFCVFWYLPLTMTLRRILYQRYVVHWNTHQPMTSSLHRVTSFQKNNVKFVVFECRRTTRRIRTSIKSPGENFLMTGRIFFDTSLGSEANFYEAVSCLDNMYLLIILMHSLLLYSSCSTNSVAIRASRYYSGFD